MAWTPRLKREAVPETPAAAELTLADLLHLVEQKVIALETVGQEITDERERYKERIVAIADQMGLKLDTCKLPGCGLPYVRVPDNKDFCIPEHKVIFNNKYKR